VFLKLDDETRHTIEEISALSGIQRDVIREVWEFTFIRWIEQITRDPTKLNNLQVPFLGTVGVRYVEDQLGMDGTIETTVDSYVSLSNFFKKIIGEVYDGKANIITELLEIKIDNAISNIIEGAD
jgi:hypothetical protein